MAAVVSHKATLYAVDNDICEFCMKFAGEKAVKCPKCEQKFCGEKCRKNARVMHKLACDPHFENSMEKLICKMYNSNILISSGDEPNKRITYLGMLLGKKWGNINMADWNSAANTCFKYQFLIKSPVDLSQIGVGFFMDIMNYEHSCDPNSYYYFVKNRVYICERRPRLPGEKITISYLSSRDLLANVYERSNKYKAKFGKPCRCSRCSAERIQIVMPDPVFMQQLDSVLAQNTDNSDFEDTCNKVIEYIRGNRLNMPILEHEVAIIREMFAKEKNKDKLYIILSDFYKNPELFIDEFSELI